MDAIKIEAIIHSARVDRDGAWRLTLEVPQSDGMNVAKLTALTERVFQVTFKE